MEVALLQHAIQKATLQQWAQFCLNTGLTAEGHICKARITIDGRPYYFSGANGRPLRFGKLAEAISLITKNYTISQEGWRMKKTRLITQPGSLKFWNLEKS